MRNIFNVLLRLILVGSIGCTVCLGQQAGADGAHVAAVAWAEYHIDPPNLSIRLPKLPVIQDASDPCSQTDGGKYHTYADGVVYEFEWYKKSHANSSVGCFKQTSFSKKTFETRIAGLMAEGWRFVETEQQVAGLTAKVLRSTSETGSLVKSRWLIWEHDGWLELGLTYRKGTTVDENRFVEGLRLSSSTGLETGAGADATLGDAGMDLKNDFKGQFTLGLVVVAKPKPFYTDAARKAKTEGIVLLRVTFLRNGSIGSISVVDPLSNGLTERAIAAARKLAFLPGTVDGRPIDVAKLVEYSFRIY